MEKIISLALVFAMLFLFVSCETDDITSNENSVSEQNSRPADFEVGSLKDIISSITDENNLTEGSTYTSESSVDGEYLDEDMINGYYGDLFDTPDFSLIEEYCVYIQDKNPLLQIELGIFKVFDSNNNNMVTNFITKRKDSILENAVNYPSVDTEPFDKLIIDSIGDYTYYIAVKENRDSIDQSIRESLGA